MKHKDYQICSRIHTFLCLPWDGFRYFRRRIWGPCNKFLLCTLVPSWDHWIPCSRNSFLCPHQMSLSCHWNTFYRPHMLMKGVQCGEPFHTPVLSWSSAWDAGSERFLRVSFSWMKSLYSSSEALNLYFGGYWTVSHLPSLFLVKSFSVNVVYLTYTLLCIIMSFFWLYNELIWIINYPNYGLLYPTATLSYWMQ